MNTRAKHLLIEILDMQENQLVTFSGNLLELTLQLKKLILILPSLASRASRNAGKCFADLVRHHHKSFVHRVERPGTSPRPRSLSAVASQGAWEAFSFICR